MFMRLWFYLLLAVVLNIVLNKHAECNTPEGSWRAPVVEFTPAATPVNLSASVSIFDLAKRLLQMHISWSPNKGGHPASSYNVHVWSLNETDSHCSMEPYYAFVEDPEITNWVLSPRPMVEAIHDSNTVAVVPGCSYRIRLEANPHDGKSYTEIDYTAPDCVDEICSCRFAETLPTPMLHVEIVAQQTVNISWSLTDLHNVSLFFLRVGPKLLDGTHSAMYNLSWSRQVQVSDHNLYQETYSAPGTGQYVATLRVQDDRLCLGPEQQLVFMVEDNEDQRIFTMNEIFWVTILPLGSLLLVICVLVMILLQKGILWFNKQKGTNVPSSGLFYKAIRMKSERVFRKRNSTLQEWNVLYIEKEIEEAKARGEADGFEISYNRLSFQREIGRGAFGQVFLARAEAIRGVPGSQLVAVKKLREKVGAEEKEEFLEEISMLKRVGQHPNIVSLLACCTLKSEICMVMEFVPCGDLLKYLRNLRQKLDARKPSITSMSDKQFHSSSTAMTSLYSHSFSSPQLEECSQLDYVLDHRELHNFALQIAKGMAHLEAKRITHRDLAARNILINNNKVLKISDFGLSRRGVYVNTRRRKVPLRWLSIEAMRDSLYSSKSDVWAFAIVLWEIGSLGGFPYPTVADYDLLHYLKSGGRLEKPEIVSQNLYSMMLICWSELADDRPSFAELMVYLEPNPDRHIYVDFSSATHLPPMTEYVPMSNLSSQNTNKQV